MEYSEVLYRAGAVLFGMDWQPGMAAYLEVDETTVRRWSNGRDALPDYVLDKLLSAVEGRLAKMARLREAISATE
jgi:hypothetical protein